MSAQKLWRKKKYSKSNKLLCMSFFFFINECNLAMKMYNSLINSNTEDIWKSRLYHSCVLYLFCLDYVFVVQSTPNPSPRSPLPDKHSMNRFALYSLWHEHTYRYIPVHKYLTSLSFSHLLRISVCILDCWILSIFNSIDFFCFINLLMNLLKT